MNAQLRELDRVEVTILLDNSIDVFLASTDEVRRAKVSTKEPWGERPALIAEHGFSVMVAAHAGGETRRMLFDAGMTTHGLAHNLATLGLSLKDFECMVLSHGHVDHTQGLVGLLETMGEWHIPVHVHPDVFRKRRTDLPDGTVRHMPAMDRAWLEARGIEFIESREPTLLLGGMLLATGEIERSNDFEQGFPPHVAEIDGRWQPDPRLDDDQALVAHVRGKGLVVVTGCCHAGAINTINHARKLTGVTPIYALLGGLHLTGSLFEPRIERTVSELKTIAPKLLMTCHCTGWKAVQRLATELPGAYTPSSVGTTLDVAAA